MRFVIVDDAHFLGANGGRPINEGLLHNLLTAAAMAFFVAVFATAAVTLFVIAIAIAGFQMDEFAIDFARTEASVAFIGIDVHGKGVFGGNTDDGVAKNGGAPFSRIDQNGDDFAILNAEVSCVFWGHVDVAFGYDDTSGDFDIPAWTG